MPYRGQLKTYKTTVSNNGTLSETTLVSLTSSRGILGSIGVSYHSDLDVTLKVIIDSATQFNGTAYDLSQMLGMPIGADTGLGYSRSNGKLLILNLPFTTSLTVTISATNSSGSSQTLWASVRYLLVV